MLIRFGVSNHRSIRDDQELSFAASPLKGGTSQPIETPGLKERLLPAALIYGANASGKSNVLHALSEMRRHVVDSFRKSNPTGRIARQPFALEESNDRPTVFDVDLVRDGVRYTYGFEVTDRSFTREWLHAYPRGHRQIWFERGGDAPLRFGKGLKGIHRAIERSMRRNSLFLSAAAQHGHAGLTSIYDFFGCGMAFDIHGRSDPDDLERNLDVSSSAALTAFLKSADVGIDSVFEREERAKGTVFRILQGGALELTDEDAHFPTRGFLHRGRAERLFEIDLEHESRGTIRMGQLTLDAMQALSVGGLLVVDEIDASLHTELAVQLLTLFTDPASIRGAPSSSPPLTTPTSLPPTPCGGTRSGSPRKAGRAKRRCFR